jgi:hypothetical protein
MTDSTQDKARDPELEAMVSVYAALKDLPTDAQQRVVDYVFARLGLKGKRDQRDIADVRPSRDPILDVHTSDSRDDTDEADDVDVDDELAGVSAIAQKWIRRNGLSAKQLSAVFSLGLDEIDVVARSVPGGSKREKMRNVLLLTCAAAYLASGAARADDEALRQSLTHYNAYDRSNFSTYMREFAADVSGTKENGYTLTARGLAAAADLIKEMTAKAQ